MIEHALATEVVGQQVGRGGRGRASSVDKPQLCYGAHILRL